MTFGLLLFAIIAAASTASMAADEACSWRAGKQPDLETYERNSIGWTNDSDDVGFLDVNLSLKYPIAPNCISQLNANARLYFAASVRFAQYLGTRDSSPVIGKRFNPKLIWRRITQWDASEKENKCASADSQCEYIDFAYAHESNGQSINGPELFHFKVKEEQAVDREPKFARDYISRGWDYLEVAARKWLPTRTDPVRIDVSLKHYLPTGLLQGHAEEYNDWEHDPEGKPRRRVSGLKALVSWFKGPKWTLGYETGYAQPFRYHTLLAEIRGIWFQMPVVLFYRNGYEGDLALYYKRTSSYGAAVELARF